MKSFFRASVFSGIGIFVIACGLTFQATPTFISSRSATSTIVPTPRQTKTATIKPTPTQAYIRPTLLPTIEPTLVPKMLSDTLSIQELTSDYGYKVQQITGWDYGFQQFPGNGYQWLDSSHLLLHPRTGEGMKPFMDGSRREDLSSQPVIVNLENGSLWLPWSNIPTPIYFSHELGIIFLQEIYSSATGPSKEAVFTYTFDGQEITHYWGKILGVSPSATKILVDDDTIIDLRNNKITDLAWYMNYDLAQSPKLYWSSDETKLYRCCFYYADFKAGKSYDFNWGDLRGADGQPASFSMHPHYDGEWVRNDSYFFPKWIYPSWAGDPFLIFSPSEKKFYSIDGANISPSYASYAISSDGMYVWISGILDTGSDNPPHGALVNLITLETTLYDVPAYDLVWSADSKYGWVNILDSNSSYVLSTASKKILPFPVNPKYDIASWHPKENVLSYLVEDGQVLAILNAKDMTVQKWNLPASVSSFLWSPSGDRIAFISKDGSLWLVNYPNLDNLEQLTPALPNVSQINWSPDGNSIAFISGSDIYIIETTNK